MALPEIEGCIAVDVDSYSVTIYWAGEANISQLLCVSLSPSNTLARRIGLRLMQTYHTVPYSLKLHPSPSHSLEISRMHAALQARSICAAASPRVAPRHQTTKCVPTHLCRGVQFNDQFMGEQ